MSVREKTVSELFKKYPGVKDYFLQIAVPIISTAMTVEELFHSLSEQWFRDSGLTENEVQQILENIIAESENRKNASDFKLKSLKICGGHDKDGNAENLELELFPGDIYGITGLTGSGKTRFLEDIEYIAEGDSPSGRKVLVNGKTPLEEERDFFENHLCASLSQSMNFVMELSCKEFISLHAECRKKELSEKNKTELVSQVIECANSLAGERIFEDSVITQLSGGQSRALMIADIALVSDASVVLIDEPENAGIDKDKILSLLSSKGKIVLVSTHDPVIALSCKKRIVIKNGAAESILETTAQEEKILQELKEFDEKLKKVRDCIREGKNVC